MICIFENAVMRDIPGLTHSQHPGSASSCVVLTCQSSLARRSVHRRHPLPGWAVFELLVSEWRGRDETWGDGFYPIQSSVVFVVAFHSDPPLPVKQATKQRLAFSFPLKKQISLSTEGHGMSDGNAL